MPDPSNGYERISAEFLAGRGNAHTRSQGIGVAEVRHWAQSFSPGASVIDIGCGAGFPLTAVLVEAGLDVYAIDAAPSMVAAFRRNLPDTAVACESVDDPPFFHRSFDGVLSWGLIFLLTPEQQRNMLQRVARILAPGGRLLFTACEEPLVWNDAMTGLESVSLGGSIYRSLLQEVGLTVAREYEDVGENHYYEVLKPPAD